MAGGSLKILCVCLCFQIVLCQFGFFPTREERRYPSPFGFSQNFFPNAGRITNTLSKLLHFDRENPFSNPSYIYPFQNRPITNPNQNSYPNNVRFPGQGQTQFPNSDQPNNSGYPENSANVPGFDNNNGGFINDPAFSNYHNPGETITSGQQNGPVFGSEASNIGNGGTESLQSGQQTGPVFGGDESNGNAGNLNSGQPNNSGYPENSVNVPGFDNNNGGLINDPHFTNNHNPGETITSGQQNGPVFGSEASNIGNGGTESLQSGQQTGPVFGGGESNGISGNLNSGQQNGPVFGTDLPNLENNVPGQQSGPDTSHDLPNSDTGNNLVSGQHNGQTFSTEAPNFANGGTDTLVSGQQTGPIFGQGSQNGKGSLVSGEHNGNAFSTEAPNFGNGSTGFLISGQQTGPTFGHDLTNNNNGENSLVSGQNNGPAFSTEAPNIGNGGTGTLASGEQSGPVFGQDIPNSSFGGTGNLVSGQQNGLVFGTESPNTENKGTLITGEHSGPVYDPDLPVPAFASRNDFNQGIFKETCTTVDGGIGTCISIITCPPYVTLLQQAQTNPAAVQKLRAAHCGFEGNNPKVCCPLPAPPTEPPTETPSGKSIPTSDLITAFPEPPICGLSNASFSRVVGGVDAKLGDFPWMALLGYQGRRGASTRWLCGGSLISHHHILTAAHCIHNHEEDLYLVRLGELDLARDDEGATPVDILIKYKIKHEKYNATSFTNDIGLLVLERDVDFTDLIRPICIPTRADLRANNFVDYNPLIAGWGDTEFRGPSASHLQVLQLPVLDNSYCSKAYSRYEAQVIDERVMCAGFKKGGKDACQGDSGGPLMQPDYNPVEYTTYFYQTGVVSFGRKCAEAGFPGIYTRVTYFVPWLEQHVIG